MKQYFIYIMANDRNTVLYTGVTNSLVKRIGQHKSGAIPGFTKKYNLHKFVYFEEFGEIDQAIAQEKQIKGWTRSKKNALIEALNPAWRDLFVVDSPEDYGPHNDTDPSLRSG